MVLLRILLKIIGYGVLYIVLFAISAALSIVIMGVPANALSDCNGMNCLGQSFAIIALSVPCGLILSTIVMVIIWIWFEGKPPDKGVPIENHFLLPTKDCQLTSENP